MSYEDEHKQLGEQIDALCAKRAFAPHCDQLVLHAPGTCWSCDGYPDWQSARLTWGINFTGESDPEKAACPAELKRNIASISRWGGNVAETDAERARRLEDFNAYLADLKDRARDFGASREYLRPVLGSWWTSQPETRLQRARRRLFDIVHYHF